MTLDNNFYYMKDGFFHISVLCETRKDSANLLRWCREYCEGTWRYRGAAPLSKAMFYREYSEVKRRAWRGPNMMMMAFENGNDAAIFSLFWV